MRVVFLDIDGVLNGWNFTEYVRYHLWRLIPFKPIKKLFTFRVIDEKRVKRLAKICNETNAKVVISSSWRHSLLTDENERRAENDQTKLFWKLMDKYHIEVIGKTPSFKSSHNRQYEILHWLFDNKDDVDEFVVLDDEATDLQAFVGSVLVKTSYVGYHDGYSTSKMKWIGIRNEHVEQAIKILKGE